MLSVPTHDVPARGILDADLQARARNADAGAGDRRDELLSLLVRRLGVLRSQALPHLSLS